MVDPYDAPFFTKDDGVELMKKVKFTLYFFIILTFIPIKTVSAEENSKFPVKQFPYTELSIQIMPEFTTPKGWPEGQPAVLIGYHGNLINQTGQSYSGAIELPIPTKEENFTVGYLAQYAEQGEELIELEAEMNQEKGIIRWKPTKPIEKDQTYEFVIEYYYIPKKDGKTNYFAYSLTPESKIERANIIIYQPVGASEFKIKPITDYRSTNEYGVPIYIYQYSNLAQNQKKDFQISYLKEGTKTTLDYIHEMQLGVNPHSENQNEAVINSVRPLISDSSAYAISIAIVISAILFFLASRNRANERNNRTGMMEKEGQEFSGDVNDQAVTENEMKQLRKLYAEGRIDQQTYLIKLNQLKKS